jgi:hypothetical protein
MTHPVPNLRSAARGVCREYLALPAFALAVFVTLAASQVDAGVDRSRLDLVSSGGVWGPGGRVLASSGTQATQPRVVPDGQGGTFQVWVDHRVDGAGDVYAQRLSGAGIPQWGSGGVPVCVAVGGQYEPSVVGDGSGGAIVSWTDGRSGTSNVYAQRITAAGAAAWATDGVRLCA